MPKISVIVPVYNAEKWLNRCVDSILAQTFTNFELILVNDGSPDVSGQICDKYKAIDPRVRVIHKQNGGVSSARNAALDIARGEYIAFIDSDDYIKKDYLSELYDPEYAIIFCQYNLQKGNATQVPAKILTTKSDWVNILNEHADWTGLRTPWGKLIHRQCIELNKIRFNEKMHFGEDSAFLYEILIQIPKAKIINYSGYIYCDVGAPKPQYYLSNQRFKYSINTIESALLKISNKKHLISSVNYTRKVFYDVYVGGLWSQTDYQLIKNAFEFILRGCPSKLPYGIVYKIRKSIIILLFPVIYHKILKKMRKK